jgi:predicted transcriptional regulator
MASKRELIDTGTDKRYVRRDEQGRFKESDDVGKSLAQDRRKKAKTEGSSRHLNQPRKGSETLFTITLSPDRASKIEDLAKGAGVPPEELLRAKVEDWLDQPQSDFSAAAAYVLKKNAELYRRLA